MEQHIFNIFIDQRGRHKEGTAIYNAAEVNLQQKHWAKMYFFSLQKGWNYKKVFKMTLFLSVLHKDVLFHC